MLRRFTSLKKTSLIVRNSRNFSILHASAKYDLSTIKETHHDFHVNHLVDTLSDASEDIRNRFVACQELTKLEPDHPGLLVHQITHGDRLAAFPVVYKAAEKLEEVMGDDQHASDLVNRVKMSKKGIETQIQQQLEHDRDSENTIPYPGVVALDDMDWNLTDDGVVSSIREKWLGLHEKYSGSEILDVTLKSWSVSTGQIELLYNLSAGMTYTYLVTGVFPRPSTEESLGLHLGEEHEVGKIEEIVKQQYAVMRNSVDQMHTGGLVLTAAKIKKYHAGLVALSPFASQPHGRFRFVYTSPGEYKYLPNSHYGSQQIRQYCPPADVPGEMEQLCKEFENLRKRDDVDVITKAAWLHYMFSSIHPFVDGNGRVARLLTSLILFESVLPLFSVPNVSPFTRDGYLQCLKFADRGSLAPLTTFIWRSLGIELDMIEKALEERYQRQDPTWWAK